MRTAQAHRPSIIIGTDCPALGLSELMSAQHCIQEQQAVCIPANDGGYVLLGLPYSAPVLYQQIHWGSSRVLRQTRRQARRSQLSWHEQASLPDLDTPADYWREKRLGRL